MEHEELVALGLEHTARTLDTRRGVAEHRCGNQGSIRGRGRAVRRGVQHSTDSPGSPCEHAAADPVQSADVDDGRDHHDVLDADESPHIAARQRGHHHLRNPERQGAHRCRADRRARAAAHGNNRVYPSGGMEFLDHPHDPLAYGGHGCAAISLPDQLVERVATGLRHLPARDVGGKERGAKDTCVNRHRLVPASFDQLRQELDFPSLRVEGAENDHAGQFSPPGWRPPAPGPPWYSPT
jgi:hypothetical protein